MASDDQRIIEGKSWPDLVLVRDTGSKGQPATIQVRVQVEVVLTAENASYMKQWLYGRQQDLTKAKECVERSLQGKNVSPATKQIIEKALNNTMVQGKSWPDLVLVKDSGRPPEFRVQCEIDITNPDDANTLETKLYGSSSERDYKGAYEIVKKYFLGDASPSFKEIVEIGFMGQPGSAKPPA